MTVAYNGVWRPATGVGIKTAMLVKYNGVPLKQFARL
jgi:hypothetical protein